VSARGFVLFGASLAALVSGCGHAPGYPPDPIPRPDAVTNFAALYSQNCAACHGVNGQNGPAIDLANPEYQALVSDITVRGYISGGMLYTEMPAFAQSQGGMLTDAQVNALVAGMRQQWSRPNAFAGAVPPYAQTGAPNPHRGELAYQAHCVSCHEPSHQQITSPVYLALVSDEALLDIIVAGRPDIGQPDWRNDAPAGKTATPLTSAEVYDIISYLASLRHGTLQLSANASPSRSATDERQTK